MSINEVLNGNFTATNLTATSEIYGGTEVLTGSFQCAGITNTASYSSTSGNIVLTNGNCTLTNGNYYGNGSNLTGIVASDVAISGITGATDNYFINASNSGVVQSSSVIAMTNSGNDVTLNPATNIVLEAPVAYDVNKKSVQLFTTASTSNTSATTIYTLTPASSSVYSVEYLINARDTTLTSNNGFTSRGVFQVVNFAALNVSSIAQYLTIIGSGLTTPLVSVSVSGSTILLQVQSGSSNAMVWDCLVKYVS